MIVSSKSDNTVDENLLKELTIKPRKFYSAKLGCNVIQNFSIDCDEENYLRVFVEYTIKDVSGSNKDVKLKCRVCLKSPEDMITIMEEALAARPVDIWNSSSFKEIVDSSLNDPAVKELEIFTEDEILLTGLGICVDRKTNKVISFSRTLMTTQKNTVSYELRDNIIFDNSSFEANNNFVYFYDEYRNRIFEIKENGTLMIFEEEPKYDLLEILNTIKYLPTSDVRHYLFNNFVMENIQENKRQSIADSFDDIELF